MRPPERTQLEPRHALALGLLHGPAELLPVSSSGHTELVPWLLDWSYAELDGELRKAFEVALHAGTAAALLVALHGEVGDAVTSFDARAAALCHLSLRARRGGGPPSLAASNPMTDSYAAAGVDTAQADRGVDALVEV